MPLPIIGAIAGAGGATLLDYALGRPLNLWGQTISAQQAPSVRSASYDGNWVWANVVPPADAILEGLRRGLISQSVAKWALNYQGVAWGPQRVNQHGRGGIGGENMPASHWAGYRQLWEQVAKMRRSRPDAATVMRLGFQHRLDDQQWAALSAELDWDYGLYRTAINASYEVPGIDSIVRLQRLGRITDSEYQTMAYKLGWYQARALEVARMDTPIPPLTELARQNAIGWLGDEDYAAYAEALGHTWEPMRRTFERSRLQMPGGPDLMSLAVRDAWDENVVRRWGYDADYPEPVHHWMRVSGWGWGRGFVGRDGRQYPAIPWSQLMWRAHWRTMPLNHAYQARYRFRPERLWRYRAAYPNIQPFTAQHLADVIKVADYPPAMRDWLAALSSPILPVGMVRIAYRYGARDRDWAVEQMRDRGYVEDDARAQVDIIDAQRSRQLTGDVDRLILHEVIAGYGDGLVPREVAAQRLSNLGVGAVPATQLLNLEDSRRLRQSLRGFLAAVRKSFLSGALSAAEAAAHLRAGSVTDQASARYLRQWTTQLSAERRVLSTGQVAQMVATGALSPVAASARLANLHWTAPDAALLLQQAGQRFAANQARAAAQAAAQAQHQRKQLEAAAKQAEAAARQARQQLRSTTPLGILRRWVQLGIRRTPWVRQRMLAMGYDTTLIDSYLSQWVMEYEMSGGTEPPAVKELQTLLRRQTPLGTLKRWYQRGVATRSWITRRMNDAGYTPESISGYQREWDATLPKGASGPAQEGSPFPAPP